MNMINRSLGAAMVPAVMMLILGGSSGCATIMTGRGPDQEVRINSNPSGARVILNGEDIGQTPARAHVPRDFDHHVRIEHEGYVPVERELRSRLNPWLLGNIVIIPPLGTIAGLAVDLISESHRLAQPRRMNVTLRRVDGAAPVDDSP